MVKKKSSKSKKNTPQEFSSSPFKKLKGLSAFAVQEPPTECGASKLPASEVKQSVTSSKEHHSFTDEMDFLGVKPLAESVVESAGPVKAAPDDTHLAANPSREEREEAAFLDAVGSVEKVFKDEWPEEEPVKRAAPRRMKQVERGQLKPEAKLDLHGLNVDEATAKVRFFLRDAVYHGFYTALIITGKGLHSSDGPVLRKAVETLLSQQSDQVVEWGVAPRLYGGAGALIVFLRRPVS